MQISVKVLESGKVLTGHIVEHYEDKEKLFIGSCPETGMETLPNRDNACTLVHDCLANTWS